MKPKILFRALKLKFKKRERIYIVPTFQGLLFGSVTLSIFVFATSVQNEALFVFTFLLITLGLLAMIMTNSNLRKISMSSPKKIVTKVGETFLVHTTIETDSRLPHLGLCIVALVDNGKRAIKYKKQLDKKIHSVAMTMSFNSPGVHHLKELRATSVYPTGMFCAWKAKTTKVPIFVAPRAIDHLKQSKLSRLMGGEKNEVTNPTLARIPGIDEFDTHKEYLDSDRTSRIDWKVSAKLQKLHVREYVGVEDSKHATLIKLSDYYMLNPQDALEQVSFEVEKCFSEKCAFGLELEEKTIEIGRGLNQLHTCRLELAQFFDKKHNNLDRQTKRKLVE